MPIIDFMKRSLTIGMAQISPVWLNREATIEKMLSYIADAAGQKWTWLFLEKHCCPVIHFGLN